MVGAGFNYIINGKYWIFSNNCNEISFRINLWPVGVAVIAPCIERNAEAVIRVISSATHSCLVGGRRNSIFILDDEVDVELKTGRDLKTGYKETSKKGLSIKYKSKKFGENKSNNIEDNK